MKKFSIALVSIAFICGITYSLFLYFMPIETQCFTEKLKEFINQPLPIIGVSLVVVGTFIVKVFAETSLGKRQIADIKETVGEFNEKVEQHKEMLENAKLVLQEQIEALKQEKEKLEQEIIELCAKIPNKKVQEFGKELENGKEKTNTETTEE